MARPVSKNCGVTLAESMTVRQGDMGRRSGSRAVYLQ